MKDASAVENQPASWVAPVAGARQGGGRPTIGTRPDVRGVLQTAMSDAASNLSGLIGRPIHIDVLQIEAVPLGDVVTHVGAPESEIIGVYLVIDGDLNGQAILMFHPPAARRLVDLLLGMPAGATSELGEMERSALAEVGNVTVAGFVNAVCNRTELAARLSPPAVVVDMLGAILNSAVVVPVSVASAGEAGIGDEVLIVETVFTERPDGDSRRGAQETIVQDTAVRAHFWILPQVPVMP